MINKSIDQIFREREQAAIALTEGFFRAGNAGSHNEFVRTFIRCLKLPHEAIMRAILEADADADEVGNRLWKEMMAQHEKEELVKAAERKASAVKKKKKKRARKRLAQ